MPSIHLTPDGRRIVIEQYEWRSVGIVDGKLRRTRFRTGKLAIYDADTGSQTAVIILDPASDDQPYVHLVNFSDDSRYLYYWFDNKLYSIDLETGRVVFKTSLPDRFDPTAVVAGG